MKKLVAMVLAMALAFSLAACGGSDGSSAAAGGSSAAAGGSSAVGAAAGSSGKIAVIRQLANSDHTTQFFAGCIAEGEALGYTVDTFTADGDDVKMQDLMEQALQRIMTSGSSPTPTRATSTIWSPARWKKASRWWALTAAASMWRASPTPRRTTKRWPASRWTA